MAEHAVVYAAKSTEDKHGSIPSQLEACREHAARQGWQIEAEFQDEAVSAYTESRGPGLRAAKERAAALAAEGQQVVLLVFSSDRLARGDGKRATHLIEHWIEAHRADYALAAVTEDLSNLVMTAMLGERAHLDSHAKAEHVKRGMRSRAQRGDYSGGPAPYGYRWRSRQAGDVLLRDIVPDRAEAAIVRRIFREFIGGRSQSRIARDLHRDGIPARRTEWRQVTLSSMLRNPIYTGQVRFREEVLPGNHKRIIDAETWEAAQRLLAISSRTYGGPRGRPVIGAHLLSRGMLICGACGGTMVPRTIRPRRGEDGKLYETYRCATRLRDSESCAQPPIERAAVDTAVLDYFFNLALDTDATRAELEAAQGRERVEVQALRAEAERQRMLADSRLARVRRDYQDGKLEADDWAQQREELTSEAEAAAADLERLQHQEEEVAGRGTTMADHEDLIAWLTEVRAAIAGEVQSSGDTDAVRSALLRLFERFVLRQAEAGTNWWAQPPEESPVGGTAPVRTSGTGGSSLDYGYIVEPIPRPDAVTLSAGYAELAQVALARPRSENNQSGSSPSQ